MKEIVLKEDDAIFDAAFTPNEYSYYIDHKEAFRTMWKEQGDIFWLNTITKFRVYNVKHGNLSPFNSKYFCNVFLNLTQFSSNIVLH